MSKHALRPCGPKRRGQSRWVRLLSDPLGVTLVCCATLGTALSAAAIIVSIPWTTL